MFLEDTDPGPMPADFALDDPPPITDADLESYFDLVEQEAAERTADPSVAEWPAVAEHPVRRWRIEDPEAAEWAMRTLLSAEDTVAGLAAQRDAWMARIGRWFDQAARQPQRTVAYMTERLEDYGVREREAHPRVATIPLPSGKIKTTASAPAAEVADDEAVALWMDLRVAQPPVDADDEALARWRLWCEAVNGATTEDKPLVRRTAKVYADPFRKVVHIGHQQVAERITVHLACEHSYSTILAQPAPDCFVPVTRGDVVECPVCEPDPIDGAHQQPVAEVITEPVLEPVVLGPDDLPVPGAKVRPGAITAKVSA